MIKLNKFNKIFLGFLVFVTLTGCSLSYDDGNNNNNNNETKADVSNNTEVKKDIKVVDAINFTSSYYSDKIHIVLPKISGYYSDSIDSINKKILDENIDYFIYPFDFSNLENVSIMPVYNYTIKNDVLLISIISNTYKSQSGGGSYKNYYFYDIKNDKELKPYDGLKALGFSDEDLLNNSSNCSFENGEPGNKCSIDAIKSDLNLESRSRCSKITVENGNIKLGLTDWCI